jgi:hypothetical protein
MAVFDGKPQLVRLLLNAQADPNLKDCHGPLGCWKVTIVIIVSMGVMC